jgi:predicted ester cyclase
MASHRDTSRRAFDAYTTGDFSGLEDAFTADHRVHDTQNPFVAQHGIDVLRGQVELYRTAFPDLVMTVDAQYEDGGVVISRWTATGTQTGDLPVLSATGRHATVTGIQIDRYEGERIAETWGSWDTLGMLQQLGAVPVPEAAAG